MNYYKIRRKSNPTQFIKGTPLYHSFTSNGRVFHNLGQLRNFITRIVNTKHLSVDLSDWEVVELEVVVKETKAIHEIITAKKLKDFLMR